MREQGLNARTRWFYYSVFGVLLLALGGAFTGLVLLVNEQMIEVDNWNQVQANLESEEEQTDSDEEFELGVATDPENNTPPIANPDNFGVRPGRTVWLPVLSMLIVLRLVALLLRGAK